MKYPRNLWKKDFESFKKILRKLNEKIKEKKKAVKYECVIDCKLSIKTSQSFPSTSTIIPLIAPPSLQKMFSSAL